MVDNENKNETDAQILKSGAIQAAKWTGKTIQKTPDNLLKLAKVPKAIIKALPEDNLIMGLKRATASLRSGVGVGEDWKITQHRAMKTSNKNLGIDWSLSAKVAGGEKKIALEIPRYLLTGKEIKEFEAWKAKAANGSLEESENKLAILDKALKEFGGGVRAESSPATRDPYKTIIIIKIDPNQSDEKLEEQIRLVFKTLGIEGEKKGAERSALKRLQMHRADDGVEKPEFNTYEPQPVKPINNKEASPQNKQPAFSEHSAAKVPATENAALKAAAANLPITLQPHTGGVTPGPSPAGSLQSTSAKTSTSKQSK